MTTSPSDTSSAPPVDFEALEHAFAQRCPYCRTKLGLLAETKAGDVWVCLGRDHGWPLLFWGGEHGEEGYRNVSWLVDALISERGLRHG